MNTQTEIITSSASSTTAPEPAIRVQNIGKMYQIYDRPQDRLKQMLFWRFGKMYSREFWALHDISFEVQKGEAVGIIGRNGSGKSTLMQIIAGTLMPTRGTVQINGRVSALLELGSGFNPHFTGRENVFLNGSILGIGRAEMERRFDDIAAFADIGKFIDQPVKTYSSGMYARLAFAVAISVDPNILIVDEILSVGDMGFQQKCVARLRKMRESGLTMLFVSHSADAIKSICSKGLFLIEGRSVFWGKAEAAINTYFNYIRAQTNKDALATQKDLISPIPLQTNVPGQMRYGTGHVQIQQVETTNEQGEPTKAFQLGDMIYLNVHFLTMIDLEYLSVSFLVRDLTGIDLMGTTTFDEKFTFPPMAAHSSGVVRFGFVNHLRAGNFGISVALNRIRHQDKSDNVLFDQVDGCASFAVIPNPDRPVHYKVHVPISVSFEVVDETALKAV